MTRARLPCLVVVISLLVCCNGLTGHKSLMKREDKVKRHVSANGEQDAAVAAVADTRVARKAASTTINSQGILEAQPPSLSQPSSESHLAVKHGGDAATDEDKEQWFDWRRRRTRRRREMAAALDFGGASSGESWKGWTWSPSGMVNGNAQFTGTGLDRPQLGKSEKCLGSICEDCEVSGECWHGEDVEYAEQDVWGKLKTFARGMPSQGSLNIMAPGACDQPIVYDSYALELSLKCTGDKGSWYLKFMELFNGKLELIVNHKLEKTFDKDDALLHRTLDHTYSIPIPPGQDSTVRLVWRPTDTNFSSKATVVVTALNIDKEVEECMVASECMKELGAQQGFEFMLRNSNTYQWQCLEGQTSLFPADLEALCHKWLECMPTEKKDALKFFLRSVFNHPGSGGSGGYQPGSSAPNLNPPGSGYQPGGGLLLEQREEKDGGRGTAAGEKNQSHLPEESWYAYDDEDPNLCVDPFTEDPETWQCNCMDNMEAECGGIDQDCFWGIMCKHEIICKSWKNKTSCPAPSDLLQVDMAKRSTQSKSGKIQQQETSKDGLDESLAGKCV